MCLRILLIAGSLSALCACRQQNGTTYAAATIKPQPSGAVEKPSSSSVASSTQSRVYLHNVDLHESADLTLRVRWLRAVLNPAKPGTVPSFDDPKSFVLTIQDGVVGLSLADLSKALDNSVLKKSALKNVHLTQEGEKLKLTGTLHKGLPLPIAALSALSASPDGRIHIHIDKVSVLKIPVKGLLKMLDVKTADLIDPKGVQGIEVHDDDLYIDAEKVLPEPRKRGKITSVRLANSEVIETYGDARADILKREDWRNYLAIFGGSLGFGKLSMQHADIVMIDVSKEDWFEFDIHRYQEQLVNGYMKFTANSGVRLFIPGITSIPANPANQSISREWLKNRNLPPPDPLARP